MFVKRWVPLFQNYSSSPQSVTAIISKSNLISFQAAAGDLFLLGSGILAVGNIYGLLINMEVVEPYTKFYLGEHDGIIFNPKLHMDPCQIQETIILTKLFN